MLSTACWKRNGLFVSAVLVLGGVVACRGPVYFPDPAGTRRESGETVYAYDTDHDGVTDYWQYRPDDGRKTALAWLDHATGRPGPRLELDAITADACPHYIIVLDGVPFEIVEQLYREGHFRLFRPPSRVICCYPAMTDLALSQFFHSEPCDGYEAVYYDRVAGKVRGGTADYLSGKAAPWLSRVDYRCSMWLDGQSYLDPQSLFEHELRGFVNTLRRHETGQAVVYSVGSAGLGTRGGRDAIAAYLRTIDRLCEQIVYERRGRVKITVTADHGHNLVHNERVSFRETLAQGGYHVTKALHHQNDVVEIAYGLVTYAAFYTDDKPGVARCLLEHEAVAFTCYADGDAVVVCDRDGTARITKAEGGYVYDAHAGDPLKLAGIIAKLRSAGKVSPAGVIDEPAMFAATVEHEYPDPLDRLWFAFHGLVRDPADVIANLRDGWCHGSKFFYTMIGGDVASTHGSLNRINSTTFVMTMLGDLPSAMRSRDVLPALEKLRKRR